MNWLHKFFTSSIGKKILMALTGLFLISFLIVHGAINAMIFYNDGGATSPIGLTSWLPIPSFEPWR